MSQATDFAAEKQNMLLKAARGELTFEDTKRYIEMRRSSWLADATRADAAAAAKPTRTKKAAVPEQQIVDFF